MSAWPGANGYRLRPHCVYRAYDADGALLYVGCTLNFDQRRRQHRSKPWFDAAVRWETEWHPDFQTGRAVEREAIRTEGPIHNVPAVVRAKRTVATKRRLYDRWPTATRTATTEAAS